MVSVLFATASGASVDQEVEMLFMCRKIDG